MDHTDVMLAVIDNVHRLGNESFNWRLSGFIFSEFFRLSTNCNFHDFFEILIPKHLIDLSFVLQINLFSMYPEIDLTISHKSKLTNFNFLTFPKF